MIILDTDCISLLERKGGVEFFRLSERLAQLQPDEITTTIITFEEQMRGWMAYLAHAGSVKNKLSRMKS
jgi:tRNA(fMet)-specific endonuclease VapC